MKIGSLFSGIGGLELGLERAGLGHTVFQVEIDAFCRGILAKHWPGVTQHEDVRSVGSHNLESVDVLCGGFPCQDVSAAGARRGLDGEKSGLWYEYRRIVGELRPRFVIVENVTSGKKLWLPTVREDLGSLGYRARAFALSAFDVGAPHVRRRVFLVATTDPLGLQLRDEPRRRSGTRGQGAPEPADDGEDRSVADATRHGRPEREGLRDGEQLDAARCGESDAVGSGEHLGGWWAAEPPLGRVAHGVPSRVDRLKALGNAVVPQCAEVIGKILMEHLS